MWKTIYLLVAILALATANPSSTTPDPTEATTQECDDAAHQHQQMMQVQISEIDSASTDNVYHYICYAGVSKTGNLMCSIGDLLEYNSPHDVDVKLRCPAAGTGKTIAYIEVQAWLTTSQLQCYITEGGVGQGYVGIRLSAYKTLSLKYDSEVHSYN